jgi:hypothetical protein
MARFLSEEWFEELGRQGAVGLPGAAGPEAGMRGDGTGPVAVEIVVTASPEGEVRYQVVVEGGSVRTYWRPGELEAPDVRFTCDYATISAIAQGRLAAVEALAQGRVRVWGGTTAVAALPAVELVPAALRARTSY